MKSCIGFNVASGEVRRRVSAVLQKTGRPVQFEICETVRDSLTVWPELRGSPLEVKLFAFRLKLCPHIGTRHCALLVTRSGCRLRS